MKPNMLEIETDTDLYEIIARRRGWDKNFFNALNQEPIDAVADIDKAVAFLNWAETNRLEVTVLTDYDVDGISSGILTYAGGSELGLHMNIVVPSYEGSRDVEPSDIRHALDLYPNTAMFITCDEATNSTEGIRYAQSLGRPVIVTDHHHELEPSAADVLINPNRQGSVYSQPDICGAQTAYHLIDRYARLCHPDKIEAISYLKVFAGIGAVADVMPIHGQTRNLVKTALSLLRLSIPKITLGKWGKPDSAKMTATSPNTAALMDLVKSSSATHDGRYLRAFYGLSLLMRTYAARGSIKGSGDIDMGFLGFTFAPTFNATRRVKGDMHDAFNIFAPQSVEISRPGFKRTQTQSAETLIANNERRKLMTAEYLDSMMDSFDEGRQPNAPYVWKIDAPAGILGLLASRVADRFHCPTAVVKLNHDPNTGADYYSGSGRAPGYVGILTAVNGHPDPAIHAAGHEQACGVFADGPDPDHALTNLSDALRRAHENALADPDLVVSTPADLRFTDLVTRPRKMTPRRRDHLADIDLTLPPMADQTDLFELMEQIDLAGPFGHGFDYPDISVTFNPSTCKFSTMGASRQHVKIITETGFTFLWWNASRQLPDIEHEELACAHVELIVNNFRGAHNVEAMVRAMEIIN